MSGGSDIVDRAAAAFKERFGTTPTLGSRAPGRVNLIGEHTDYNEGFVLPMAIDRDVVIAAAPTDAPQSTFVAIDLDESAQVDLRRSLEPRRGSFANYLLGVAQQFIERGRELANVNLVLTSTVPIGGGLSSSAAVEVATSIIFEQLLSIELSPLDRALLCQRAEHTFPGTPVGVMDMLVSAAARERCALLIDCRSNAYEAVPLPREAAVLIADTGVRHELSTGEYGKRRATCESAARKLGLKSLRDATIQQVRSASLTAVERLRATHVITENARTLRAAEAMTAGDLETLGELMFASHASLRDDYEVSSVELDAIVDTAQSVRDAGAQLFGARMTGGGFGGCAVVLCAAHAEDQIAAALRAGYHEQLNRELKDVFPVQASAGAMPLHLIHRQI